MVEHDSVADVADLAGGADVGPGQDLLILAALHQHHVSPRATPRFEQPPEDVGGAGGCRGNTTAP